MDFFDIIRNIPWRPGIGDPSAAGWLTVIFYFALPKSRPQYQRRAMRAGMLPCANNIDLDNLVKSIKDGLNGVVWVDDRQVTTLVAHKRWAEESSVLVRITPQGEPDGQA